ncbi:MAG: DUF1007 family protein [Treponema sp.]|mgnify:CR=1 FL=1|nr:DUF1007 family protein [Treponema sp.]
MKHFFSLIFFILISSISLFSHPHMFMECSAEFVWNKDKLSGVFIEWTFDQFFSADIIAACDKNQDGKFNALETQNVYDSAFINLRHYYYFTFIRQGDKRTNPSKVEKFSVSQKNGVMKYNFFIDLSDYKQEEINVAIYDYTFFCAIDYTKENPVKLTYDKNYINPRFDIIENRKYPVYYNPLGAIDDTTIYYEYKKGLQTYYPKEIKISYE